MKTYFNYQSDILSQELNQAIASPLGLGPFSGFSRGEINSLSTYITLYAKPTDLSKNYEYYEMLDLIARRYVSKMNSEEEEPQVNFGCVARDGVIYTSTEDSMELYIQGTKGFLNEVIVFAYHLPVNEAVDNPVTFVAYWNNSNISFYDLYKKTQDVYYPTDGSARVYNLDIKDPARDPQMNYAYLDNQIRLACSEYNTAKVSMVPVGIYGTGTDSNTNITEPFAIVPYLGKFPMALNYNTALHNAILQSIKAIEDKFVDILDYNTIKAYIDAKIKESIQDAIIPSGTIVLWDGDTIPDGWRIYEPAQGKVVIGYQSGGISIAGRTVLTALGDTTPIEDSNFKWDFRIDKDNVPVADHHHTFPHTHVHDTFYTGYDRDIFIDGNPSKGFQPGFSILSPFGTAPVERVIANESDFTRVWYEKNTKSQSTEDTQGVLEEELSKELYLSKMPPAVTLRYIQKI